jgi:hypothetical protein
MTLESCQKSSEPDICSRPSKVSRIPELTELLAEIDSYTRDAELSAIQTG